jgi:hypothetical protein
MELWKVGGNGISSSTPSFLSREPLHWVWVEGRLPPSEESVSTHGKIVYLLADELKSLIGWGVQSNKVHLCPNLRAIAGVGAEVPSRIAKTEVRRYIKRVIHTYPGGYEWHGQPVSPETIRMVFATLLKVIHSDESAEDRRERAILNLSACVSVDYWRNGGAEWECMLALAEWMVEQAAEQAA